MADFDPRLTPARPDLAASHLRGKVEAARFVDGTVQEVIAGQAPVRREPSHGATLRHRGAAWASASPSTRPTRTAGPGDSCKPTATSAGCRRRRCWRRDRAPTHKVAALRTLVFPGPSIKAPPAEALPFGAQIAVARMQGELRGHRAGGYVPARHLAPIAATEPDFVAVAERFLGAPYLWGGKTSLGLDCSGLVQVALAACGIACPRDTDMQEAAVGKSVSLAELATRRPDVLERPRRHRARAATHDPRQRLPHGGRQSSRWREAVARIGAAGSQVTSVRRSGDAEARQ